MLFFNILNILCLNIGSSCHLFPVNSSLYFYNVEKNTNIPQKMSFVSSIVQMRFSCVKQYECVGPSALAF